MTWHERSEMLSFLRVNQSVLLGMKGSWCIVFINATLYIKVLFGASHFVFVFARKKVWVNDCKSLIRSFDIAWHNYEVWWRLVKQELVEKIEFMSWHFPLPINVLWDTPRNSLYPLKLEFSKQVRRCDYDHDQRRSYIPFSYKKSRHRSGQCGKGRGKNWWQPSGIEHGPSCQSWRRWPHSHDRPC